MAAVRKALVETGLAAKDYAGHSFRIGAATTAARQGLQDCQIKTLGRWESSAYTKYIRTSPETLCKWLSPSHLTSHLNPTVVVFLHMFLMSHVGQNQRGGGGGWR